MKRILIIVITGGITCMCINVKSQWQMQPTPIQTRWTKQVNPKNVLSEYPRPQIVRSRWTNLNGLWEYAITCREAAQPAIFDGQILVPYPIESALSGVRKRVSPKNLLWYKRTIHKPAAKERERILLHFGAVDFDATIFINGKEIGNHIGGYQNFSFDVTEALIEPNNELVVKVWDPSDKGYNPHGKQVLNPSGIMYTPSSGIWQTVWMEIVPNDYISNIVITPDIDRSIAYITVNSSVNTGVKVQANGKTVNGKTNNVISFPISNEKLWSPDAPYLYDLKITMGQDVIKSYFGMRKIEIKKDNKGIERIFLNNKYTYNLGILDQGFWPDGLYTASTDAALKFDIEAIKRMGFNTIRKHIKIEPARWYYHCDRLGMLVWQDMVNPGNNSEEARAQFEKENKENITQLYNYPSIICWVVFNEAWGAYDQARVTKWFKDTDPTRIVNGHSGSLIVNYNLSQNTPEGLAAKSANSDVTDIHSYPPPGIPAHIRGKAMVLGEFGGIGVSIPSHLWDDVASGWGYGGTVSAGTMRKRYAVMVDSLIAFEKRGLSGSIYTQPFDVESEQNGLITYDREILKIPTEQIRSIHAKLWPATANYVLATKNFTAKVSDTGKKDFAMALKEYKSGKKDSSSLRALALLAAAEKDSGSLGGRTFANEYIRQLKDPYTECNLKFIVRFTDNSTDIGYKLLYDYKKVDSILGGVEAKFKLNGIVFREAIWKHISTPGSKPDWDAIEKNILAKYGEAGLEIFWNAKGSDALDHKNYLLFIETKQKQIDNYPDRFDANGLNNQAWSVFENVLDKKILNQVISWMTPTMTEASAETMDTYANLMYKVDNIDQALDWEQKTLNWYKEHEVPEMIKYTVGTLEKMKAGDPTWPQQESSSMK